MTNSMKKDMCFLKLTSTISRSSGVLLLLLLCYNLLCAVNVNAFNLDTLDYVKYRGDRDSMFGFSVAAHKYGDYNW